MEFHDAEMRWIYGKKFAMSIHSTALVDSRADVDSSAEIMAYAVIDGPVKIGAETKVYPHTFVTGCTEIGRNCQIHPGAVIGGMPQDRAFAGGESYCRIGDETIIREGVSIHRGTQPGTATEIGQRCFLMGNAHIGHNCQLGDDVTIANGALLAGYVEVGSRVFISGNAAVHQFVRIGELVMVGGLTKVTQDVPPFFMADGDGACVGVNSVGLKRAQFSKEERADIKQGYSLIYRSSYGLREAVQVIGKELTTDPGRKLFEFLTQTSKRGIAGRSGQRKDRNDRR